MERIRSLSLALFLIICFAANAWATTGTATFTAEGQTYNIPTTTLGPNGYLFGNSALGWTFNTSDYQVQLTGRMAIVAENRFEIRYNLILTNNSPLPQDFAFNFQLDRPFIGSGGGTGLHGSYLYGTLTDSTGNGVSISPFNQSYVQMDSGGSAGSSHDFAVTWSVGSAFSSPSAVEPPNSTFPYGSKQFSNLVSNGGNITFLDEILSFTLSGNGDIANLNSFSFIVPIPASSLLLGTGLLGLVGWRRFRKS